MGFFSQDCTGCGHPALSRHAVTPVNAWMVAVTVVTPDGQLISGEYDGYGRLDTSAGPRDAVGAANTVWHTDCWVAAGRPRQYRGPSPDSPDQGFFFDTEHDLPSPLGPR